MFRAQLTAGDANFDLYNRVKMLDEHVQYNRLKGVYVPDLSRDRRPPAQGFHALIAAISVTSVRRSG